MSTYSSGNNNASLSVPLHHVPQVDNASLHSLMRPSYLYPQHHHPPHHYHHPQQQQQQQQPAHQMTRPNPLPNGHINTAAQRIGLDGLGARPGSAGAGPPGLIDLSCSGPRFQHNYHTASDVTGKVYPARERDVRCHNVAGSRAGLQREGVNDLRLMLPSSPTDAAQQVVSVRTVIIYHSSVTAPEGIHLPPPFPLLPSLPLPRLSAKIKLKISGVLYVPDESWRILVVRCCSCMSDHFKSDFAHHRLVAFCSRRVKINQSVKVRPACKCCAFSQCHNFCTRRPPTYSLYIVYMYYTCVLTCVK